MTGHIGDKSTALADGVVNFSRILTLSDTPKANHLQQAAAVTEILVGISEVGTFLAPREDLSGALPLAGDGDPFSFIGGAGKEAKLTAGAAVATGTLITTDADGKGVVALTTEQIVGYNMGDAAVADGDEIRVVLVSPGTTAP